MIFFINDNNESIYFDGEFLLSKQAISFYSFKIKADVSVNFTIPNTSENRRILGYSGFNQEGNPAFSQLPFSVSKDGNIISKGYIVIQSDNGSELDCFYISGNTWINSLNTSIKQFDYNEFTVYPGDYIDVNRTTVLSTTVPKEYGIIFPLVDWAYEGQKATNKIKRLVYLDEWSAKDYFPEMLPVVYLHTVVSQIAKQSNIKLAGNLFGDNVYNKIVITPETADLQWPDYFVNDSLVKASTIVTTSIGTGWQKLPFENLTYPNGTGMWDSTNYRYYAKYTGIYSVTTSIITDNSDTYSFRIYINGSYVSDQQYSTNVSNSDIGTSNGYVYLEKGSYLEVYIDGSTSFNFLDGSNVSISLTKSLFYDQYFYVYQYGPYIPINAIVPDIKAIDLIKFIINYFGCVASFDQYTQTLTINKSNSIIDSEDWSEYVKSYQIDYNNDVAQNNYIKFKDVDDDVIKYYNEINPIGYGNGNIQAQRVKEERTITEFPFGASAEVLNTNFDMRLPSVGLIKLSPKDTFQFTSVTDDAGIAVLNGTFEGFSNSIDQLVFVDSDLYNGYFLITGASSTTIHIDTAFIDTDSGTVSTVQKDLSSSESRILLVNGQTDFISISNLEGIYNPDNTLIDWMPYGWFYKQTTGKYIDNYKDALAINDLVNANFGNRTISEAYYNKLTNAFKAPGLKTSMLLNEKIFQEFNFQKLIYLNTGSINGYFFVDSILNYKDSITPAQVNLVSTTFKEEGNNQGGSSGNLSLSLEPGSYVITGSNMSISVTANFNLQVKAQYNTGSSAKIYYKINSGSWNLIGSYTLTTNYQSINHSVTVNDGDTIYYGVQNASNTNLAFGTGNGGSYFGKCGQSNPYSVLAVNGMTNYLNVAATIGGYTTC